MLDEAALDAAADASTACAVLNTPHGPTGRVFSATEIDAFASFCESCVARRRRRGLRARRVSRTDAPPARGPPARERTISLSSARRALQRLHAGAWAGRWRRGPGAEGVEERTRRFSDSAPTAAAGEASPRRSKPRTAPSTACRSRLVGTPRCSPRPLPSSGLDVFPPEGGYFLCANCHEPAMAFVERSPTRRASSARRSRSSTRRHRRTTRGALRSARARRVDRACEALAPGAWLNKSQLLLRRGLMSGAAKSRLDGRGSARRACRCVESSARRTCAGRRAARRLELEQPERHVEARLVHRLVGFSI